MLEKQINAYLSFQIRGLEILGQFCQSYIENTLKPLLSSTSETSVKIGVHLRQREYSRSVDATHFFVRNLCGILWLRIKRPIICQLAVIIT
jgi:hypothetical protein